MGATISRILKVSGKKWLAKGEQRLVFAHPDDRRLVLKVQYDREGQASATRHVRREKRVFRQFEYRLKTEPNPPIVKFFGTVVTDLGPADVFEALYGPKGVNLAPTLRYFFHVGEFNAVKLQHLNVFIRKLDNWGVPVTDMNAGNFVFSQRKGQRQFVMVDGFGDYRLLPIARWSSRVRKERIAWGCRAIAHEGSLHWDEHARQFQF